jgi:hypothetical protein
LKQISITASPKSESAAFFSISAPSIPHND